MKIKLIALFILLVNVRCTKKEKTDIVKISGVLESYYGYDIEDPFRWLEDIKDSTTINWLKEQKNISENTLRQTPSFDNILNKVKTSINQNHATVSKLSITQQDDYFYLKRLPDEQSAKLYSRKTFSGEEQLVYDPAEYQTATPDIYTISYIQPSWDGKKIVIGLTKNDEEYADLVVLDVESKKIISGVAKNALPNSKGGVEWLPDNNGFIYNYTPVIDNNSKDYGLNREARIYFITGNKHKEILSRKTNPEIAMQPEDSPIIYFTNSSNDYLLGAITNVVKYRNTYYSKKNDLLNGDLKWQKLYGPEQKVRQFYLYKNQFYYRTAQDASNYRICQIDIRNPDFEKPKTLIKESIDEVITDFVITKEGIYYVKTKNGVQAKLFFISHVGDQSIEIELPKPSGNISLSSKGIEYSEIWVELEGWTNYQERYLYDVNTQKFIPQNIVPVTSYEILNDVVVEEIEVPSHDGVMVPLSIIYRKGTKLNGENRVLINAYGAYKWSNSPYLYPYLLYWLQEGGIYATAHVRGGGEKGDDWHKGGFKTTKPNSWKDLIACTKYLIEKQYTRADNIALWGASAGGITIARAITERPDLYRAAVIHVGSINMIRSEFGAGGKSNTNEFGTVNDSLEFKGLLAMDAYHHIQKDQKYPSLYLTAGMNDARVPVWLSSKFAARLAYEGHRNNLKKRILWV